MHIMDIFIHLFCPSFFFFFFFFSPHYRTKREKKEDLRSGYLNTLSKTTKTSSLNFAKCTTTADKGHRTSCQGRREYLEKIPRGIVQEKYDLQRDQWCTKHQMRHRGRTQRSWDMFHVRTNHDPLFEMWRRISKKGHWIFFFFFFL